MLPSEYRPRSMIFHQVKKREVVLLSSQSPFELVCMYSRKQRQHKVEKAKANSKCEYVWDGQLKAVAFPLELIIIMAAALA